MAALLKNYIREVEAGPLELPEYEEDEDDYLYFYYGEMFCRIPDCSKVTHNYKSTNNLRTHVSSHKDVSLLVGNSGGRASQETIDEVAKWYKELFAGVDPDKTTTGATTSPSPAPRALSALPKKKDGSVHVTNMRAEVVRMGHSVPCKSCGSRVNCCKDINKCDHFVLFNCGDLHPRAATKEAEVPQPEPNGEETA
ncbi:hypothetical protein BJX68DRAFT_273593 [Aspergillus pseudodeflectus]|uniref:C2H2-type domain-containing protein n=1 Tax=Aspergillus pseudodeflectus TaxID=176178 RepID=A0ABR4J854_9EURO